MTSTQNDKKSAPVQEASANLGVSVPVIIDYGNGKETVSYESGSGNAYIRAESTGMIEVMKGSRLSKFVDPELAQQVRTALKDTAGTPNGQAKMDYLIDDVMDDRKLNGSAPRNPNGITRT